MPLNFNKDKLSFLHCDTSYIQYTKDVKILKKLKFILKSKG